MPDGRDVKEYLIWSFEHKAWWGPNERGYVDDLGAAGRYTQSKAGHIVTRSVQGNCVALHMRTAALRGAPRVNTLWSYPEPQPNKSPGMTMEEMKSMLRLYGLELEKFENNNRNVGKHPVMVLQEALLKNWEQTDQVIR